jgi:hypothetical protein
MAEKREESRHEPAQPTLKAAVAPGRSVIVDGVRHGPGTLVELPAIEVRRLMGLGFLSNPHAAEVPVQKAQDPQPFQGPQFRGPVEGVVKLS